MFFIRNYEIILTTLFENIVSIVDCGSHKLNFCEFPIHGLLLLDVLKHKPKIKMKKKITVKNEGMNFSYFFSTYRMFLKLFIVEIYFFVY